MLELLELQARARAIRSQLALEPVTKIELDDSDAEDENSKGNDKNHTAGTSSVPPQNKGSQKEKDPKESSKRPEEPQSKVSAPRPLRLKRNFRQRQVEGYESDENQSIGEKEKTAADAEEPQTSAEKEKSVEREKSPVKEPEPESAPVPTDDDVVPIIAEPEVLCISSSDSESDDKSTSSKVKKYINMPVVVKVDRPPTEDELFLLKIKEKSDAKLKSDAAAAKDGKATEGNNEVSNAEKRKNNQEEDMEDGEIVEEDEIFEIPESPEPPLAEEKAQGANDTATAKGKGATENEQIAEQSDNLDKSQGTADDSSTSGSESGDEKKSSDSENSDDESDSSDKKSRSLASRNSKKSNVDEDDDDIIDLGKDEDLDFEQLEMNTETREEPKKVKSPRRTRSKTKSHKSDDLEKCDEPKVRIKQLKPHDD